MNYGTKTLEVTRTVFKGEPGANIVPAMTGTAAFLFIILLIALS